MLPSSTIIISDSTKYLPILSIKLKEYIEIIERFSNKKSKKNYLKIQKGDVETTSGDNTLLKNKIKKRQFTKIEKGIENYISWYKNYYGE